MSNGETSQQKQARNSPWLKVVLALALVGCHYVNRVDSFHKRWCRKLLRVNVVRKVSHAEQLWHVLCFTSSFFPAYFFSFFRIRNKGVQTRSPWAASPRLLSHHRSSNSRCSKHSSPVTRHHYRSWRIVAKRNWRRICDLCAICWRRRHCGSIGIGGWPCKS